MKGILKFLKILSYFSFLLFFLFLINFPFTGLKAVAAQTLPSLKNAAGFLGEAAGQTYGTPKTPAEIIGLIIYYILGFIGAIFLILIIYGGITWMTAGGNEDKIKKAKGLITNSIIGLVIILAAYSITWFVVSRVITATGFKAQL